MTLHDVKNDSEDVNDEIEGAMLIDNLDEESLPSEGEDTAEGIFLAVTEKRRLLGIEMETNAGRMKTIGEIPPDMGRNYILRKVRESLQEDNDDLSRARKFDTAERKFKDRGNLWKKLLSTSEAKNKVSQDNVDQSAIFVTENKEYQQEATFAMENEELKIVIPEESTLHAMLNE